MLLRPINPKNCRVPDICIGTWTMGGEHFGPYDTAQAVKTIEAAFDYGICSIDTAAFYAHGNALAVVRKATSKRRDQFMISSKGGLVWEGNSVRHDTSPNTLRQDLETTLRALKTDYLDLYSLHWPDPNVPVKDCIETLKGFKETGLIRQWGLGNLDLATAEQLCGAGDRVPFQYPHNLLRRDDTLVPTLVQKRRIESWIVSPLEQGRLGSVTHKSQSTLSQKDFRHKNKYFSDDYNQAVDAYRIQAQGKGQSLARYAIEWLRKKDYVDKLVLGARTVAQLEDVLA